MTLLAGRYELGGLIGRGGTADTYRGFDRTLGRDVAVKILVGRSEERNARFLREARAMARLNHPQIAAVYDAGQDEGRGFIVMELLSGRTLRDLLTEQIPSRRALLYLLDVLGGLEYAHSLGIIHRDVKPSNIITVEDDAHVKLTDFGLARRTSDITETTETGEVVGTISYLAPERFSNKASDVRSDLYSVGLVMYELLTGTLPFRADRDDLAATIFSLVHDLPTPPHEIDRTIPAEYERVVMQAIDRQPAKRYQTAGEFARDIQLLLDPRAEPRALAEPAPAADPALREAIHRAFSSARERNAALETVLKGMLATRRRNYDEAKTSYLRALEDFHEVDNTLEYAKTAVKYGTMILKKASDGMRERNELRDGVNKLTEALAVFRRYDLSDQMSEAEYLINALERTAIGF